MTLLNSVFILLGSLTIYLSSFLPIGNHVFSESEIQMKQDEEVIFRIGEESKLIRTFDDGQLYTINNYYEYFLRVLMKYNYEHSSYDLEEDVDNYNVHIDSFKPFVDISVTDTTVNDDFFGNFYTEFIIGKEDVNGDLVLDYQDTNPKDYFYYEVLDIDGEGSAFFKESVNGEYPYLKDDVRTALYAYNFSKNLAGDSYKTDKAFFEFFLQKFTISGDFLLKYKDYGEVLNRYNSTYDVLYRYDQITIFVSFFISFLIFIFLIPIFNKYHQNLGELIFKRAYLKDEGEEGGVISFKSHIIRSVYGLIKYFFVAFLLSLFINSAVGFNSLIMIGTFPISLFVISVLTLLFNAVSLTTSIIRQDKKNLENLTSFTRIYVIEKDYSSK